MNCSECGIHLQGVVQRSRLIPSCGSTIFPLLITLLQVISSEASWQEKEAGSWHWGRFYAQASKWSNVFQPNSFCWNAAVGFYLILRGC